MGGSKNNSGKNKIPDRWRKYTNMGRQIPGTRFIAFKVPLKEALLMRLQDASWFCPRTLMDHCVDLGLVVDLTNTTRYYDPKEFTDQGIKYAKVFTEGHKIPKDKVVMEFFKVVNTFLDENKDNQKLIGVHCTHGLNRSGYMVCRYMIQQLGIPPDQAIADFNSARGHEQERENYLANLRQASWFKNTPSTPTTPSTPSATGKPAPSDEERSDSETPTSAPPVRRWSGRHERIGDEGWAPWKGASPKGRYRSSPYAMQQSPHGARRYYDERYQGRVAPQYDPYFYQERGSGVGPHRSAPHWSRKQQQQEQAASARGPPRQYRGPRPYRSPARPEEEFSYRPDTPSAPSAPSGANFATPPPQRGSQIPSLPRTPYWPDAPDGPRRRAFSPGAQDDVFSPVTPRRRSARWNPY
ncbi:RNA/RNP complex-1-interacting phosphatase-like isoform X1 [Penaeus japonicus]|uniref:RNA/RNP complex-1-interacting phosphatase-like isoform X1 n=1 Tax=Penaeus japonicus TaxID=27405 RepID=UPI001C70CF97|nr:RNA/RNP complex-1-interacting phosphatase-like isoform X1 [Penaeus japonicus]